ERDEARHEIGAKDRRIAGGKRADDIRGALPLDGINSVMRASEQRVQVLRRAGTAGVLAHDRQIGSNLSVEQPQLLELGTGERSESAARDRVEQLLQPLPASLTLFEPSRGNHDRLR